MEQAQGCAILFRHGSAWLTMANVRQYLPRHQHDQPAHQRFGGADEAQGFKAREPANPLWHHAVRQSNQFRDLLDKPREQGPGPRHGKPCMMVDP